MMNQLPPATDEGDHYLDGEKRNTWACRFAKDLPCAWTKKENDEERSRPARFSEALNTLWLPWQGSTTLYLDFTSCILNKQFKELYLFINIDDVHLTTDQGSTYSPTKVSKMKRYCSCLVPACLRTKAPSRGLKISQFKMYQVWCKELPMSMYWFTRSSDCPLVSWHLIWEVMGTSSSSWTPTLTQSEPRTQESYQTTISQCNTTTPQ